MNILASASAVDADDGWLWTRPPHSEKVVYALQDDFVPLIAQSDLRANDAPVRFRLRLPLFQNNRFKFKFISRAYQSAARGHDCDFTCFLFLRYQIRSFKVEVEIPHQDGMIVVISRRNETLTRVWNENGRGYAICPK